MSTIAVFHPSAELYGADRILVNALKALPADVNKRVYLLRQGPLVEFLRNEVSNVEVIIRPDMPVIYRAIFNLKGIIQTALNLVGFLLFILKENRSYSFSSAYVNTSSNVLLLPLLKLAGIRRYIHIHEIIDSPKAIGWLTAFVSKWFANTVVCVSRAVLDGMMRYVPSIEKVATVIHNGIDPILTTSLRAQRSNLSHQTDCHGRSSLAMTHTEKESKLSFYLFGRIQPRKGHWFLLKSLAKVPRHLLAKCEFVLMGGIVPGQEKDLVDLNKTIKRYKLKPFIKIKDFAADVSEPMRRADVCLVPSLVKDSFPTTVIEAMSAGRPVITTNNGGAKEAVIDGTTGFLIDPNNTDQLADRIIRLIVNQIKLNDMGVAGKQQFNERFTTEIFATNWMHMIEKTRMLGNESTESVVMPAEVILDTHTSGLLPNS